MQDEILKHTKKIFNEVKNPTHSFGEKIQETFTREIDEEMGLKVTKMSRQPVYAWTWRYENRRDMEWWYSFLVAYRFEVDNLDFIPSEECEAIGFFSKDELAGIELSNQTNVLLDVFNPEDFKEDF